MDGVITPTPDGLVTREQAADLCGVTPAAITNWVREGYGPKGSKTRLRVARRDGPRPLFDPVDLARAELATRRKARRGQHAVA